MPTLLLGLAALNTAREPANDKDIRIKLETEGNNLVSRAFKIDNKMAAAALALASVYGQKGAMERANKLAERSIQYADTRRHANMGYTERGRLAFLQGDLVDAGLYLTEGRGDGSMGVNPMVETILTQTSVVGGECSPWSLDEH